MAIPGLDAIEQDAIDAANELGIPTTDPDGRGNGDARDAFRHTYVSAVVKYYLNQILPSAAATGGAFALGEMIEIINPNNYKQKYFYDLNMDLWNDAKGSLLNPTSPENAAVLAKQLLDNGELITSIDPSETRRAVGPASMEVIQDLLDAIKDVRDAINDAAYESLLDALLDYFDQLLGPTPDNPTPFSDWILDTLEDAKDLYNDALALLTPIVLDLDGDGIELTSLAGSATFFDLNNNQFAEKTGWVQPDDGLLARDLNGNGVIDNQNELFGPIGGAVHGYYKLSLLDSNSDNKIDSSDPAFSSLLVWRDLNQNGISESGELQTLSAAGIASVMTGIATGSGTNQGHAIIATSTYTLTGGGTRATADIAFQTDQMNSWFVGDGTAASVEIDVDALFLPMSRGYGIIPALHFAYSWNDDLKDMAIALMSREGGDLAIADVGDAVEAFLYEWAGVTGVATNSRGAHFDGRKLAFLEKFFGQAYTNPNGLPNPDVGQVGYLADAWNTIFETMEQRLMLLGPLAPVLNASYDISADDVIFQEPLNDTLANAESLAPAGMEDRLVYWQLIHYALNGRHGDFSVTAQQLEDAIQEAAGSDIALRQTEYEAGTPGADSLAGTSANEYFDALDGADTVNGGTGHDFLNGLGGNDSLIGGDGDDTVFGGVGNDSMTGGNNNDTFIIEAGDGNDTLSGDAGSSDTVKFGSGILWSNFTFSRPNNTDVVIGLGSGQTLRINGEFNIPGGEIETMKFADGTTKTVADVKAGYLSQAATTGNDNITGFDTNDSINGGLGNDTLNGVTGNDTYVVNAGEGNDVINDTGGTDVVSFGSGITWSGVTFSRPNLFNLVINLGSGQTLQINNAFNVTGGEVETLQFTGSVTKTMADVQAAYLGSYTTGNDTIFGFSTAETMHGGNGHDSMRGEGGNDEVYGDNGDDTLAGGDGHDVVFGWDGNDRLFGNDGNDTMGGEVGTDSLEGGNGTDSLYGGDDNDTVRGGNDADYLEGGNHNDSLFGDAGADVLAGSNGNDTLYGGAGADFIFGEYGDDSQEGGDDADTLYGWDGNDTLKGDGGNDLLSGEGDADSIEGGTGVDSIYGGDANDTLKGGDDADEIYGDAGADEVFGEAGGDVIAGGSGDDALDGGLGADQLHGQDDDDTLTGGAGADTLYGGSGADVFRFTARADSASMGGIDIINDFAGGTDLIDLSGLGFTGIVSGAGSGNVLGYITGMGWTEISAADGSFSLVLNGNHTLTGGDFDFT